MISYIVTDGGLTAVIDGRQYTVARDNPVYPQVRNAIVARDSDAKIRDLFRTAEAVRRYSGDKVEVRDGELFYKGTPLHNVVVDKVLEFMTFGLPSLPLIKFLDRLLKNPNKHSVDELYNFLEANKLPITENGYFLAYKGLREDYTDVWTGKFDNHPGKYNSMERLAVDDDHHRLCSYGFHVGSLAYATGYGPKCVVVKVDPANVVSVPEGNHSWKIRTCKYQVLCDYHGPLPKPLHTDDPYEDVWGVETW